MLYTSQMHSWRIFPWFLIATDLWARLAYAQTINLDDFSSGTLVFAGEIYSIGWSGGDGSDIELRLYREGDTYVQLVETLFEGPSDPAIFPWLVSKTLEDGADYTLRIEQGSDQDVSSHFQITGGASVLSSSSPAATISLQTSLVTLTSTVTHVSVSRTLGGETFTSIANATASATPPPETISSPPSTRDSRSLSPGAIAGISIGSIGALALVVIAVWLVTRKNANDKSSTPALAARGSLISELSAGSHLHGNVFRGQSTSGRLEKDGRAVRLSTTPLQEMPTNTDTIRRSLEGSLEREKSQEMPNQN